MLTNEDIQKLITAHAEVFPTKEDFDDLRQDFSKLQTSVLAFAKATKDNADEIKAVNNRVNVQGA